MQNLRSMFIRDAVLWVIIRVGGSCTFHFMHICCSAFIDVFLYPEVLTLDRVGYDIYL